MSLERDILHHLFTKLQSQREDINNLRNQAAISAAITGLVATVFSTQVQLSDDGSPFFGSFVAGYSLLGTLLVVCFLGSLAFSVLVVVGRKDFHFGFDGEKMLEKLDKSESEAAFIKDYIEDAEWYFQDNETKIAFAQSNLWWAMVLGFAQVLPWILML